LLKHTDMTIKELTMFYQIKFEFKLTTPPGWKCQLEPIKLHFNDIAHLGSSYNLMM
jgi:hypothetical protein